VFPIDDLGLLKGIYRLYNGGEKMTKEEVLAVGDAWRPYRSLGTWYMWRVLDPVPVEYLKERGKAERCYFSIASSRGLPSRPAFRSRAVWRW